jgi:hypothetical protein
VGRAYPDAMPAVGELVRCTDGRINGARLSSALAGTGSAPTACSSVTNHIRAGADT